MQKFCFCLITSNVVYDKSQAAARCKLLFKPTLAVNCLAYKIVLWFLIGIVNATF